MERIMVFAPHPDDDVIGCGGSIAKHVQQKREVKVVFFTSGNGGSLRYMPEKLAALREQEAIRSSAILGLIENIFLRQDDGCLQDTPAMIANITRLIRANQPDAVYLPCEGDRHVDHRMTHRIVMEALRWAAGERMIAGGGKSWKVGTVLCYEIATPIKEVGYVEDITKFMDIKMAALREHKTQLDNYAYDEAILGLNRYRGVMLGRGKYCECFAIMENTRIFSEGTE